jgi:hypothetical protein
LRHGRWRPVQLLREVGVSLDSWSFYTYLNGQPKLLNTTPVALTSLVKEALG